MKKSSYLSKDNSNFDFSFTDVEETPFTEYEFKENSQNFRSILESQLENYKFKFKEGLSPAGDYFLDLVDSKHKQVHMLGLNKKTLYFVYYGTELMGIKNDFIPHKRYDGLDLGYNIEWDHDIFVVYLGADPARAADLVIRGLYAERYPL